VPRTPSLAPAVLAALAVAAAAVAGTAPTRAAAATLTLAPGRTATLATSSGTVVCRSTPAAGARPARIRCDLLRGRRAGAAELTPRGRARLSRPPVPLRADGRRRPLRPGTVVVAGALRCSWDGADMVCMSVRSPHGFVVGRSGRALI
jgi:hypothetical protein